MANGLSNTKEIIAILKDVLIFLLIMLILIFPSKFKDYLLAAGVTKVNWGGVEWQPSLASSDLNLKDAKLTIGDLSHRLDSSNRLLIRIKDFIPNGPMKAEIVSANSKNVSTLSEIKNVQSAIQHTISSNAVIVNKVQDELNNGGVWGVVFASDASIEAAQDEIRYAKSHNIPNTSIYLRHGSYASVSVVNTKDEANQVLKKAGIRRSDAFIVPMETWCPNANSKNGYLDCSIR